MSNQWKFEPLPPMPEDELYNEVRNFWDELIARSFMIPTKVSMMQKKYPGAQISPEGQIALRYRQTGNVLLQGNPSDKEYVAITQANICLAWVDQADVDFILTKRDGCCGKKQQSFHLANEADVRRWTNRGGQ